MVVTGAVSRSVVVSRSATVDDADDIAGVGREHRVAGVAVRHQLVQAAELVGVDDRIDPGTGDHGVLAVAVGEVKGAVEQHKQLRWQVSALP